MRSRDSNARPFELSERELTPGCREIKVQGELDLAVADELRKSLERATADCSQVLVDLAECEFIDSTGIATIVRASNALAERSGRLAVCAPSAQVLRVLSLTGLADSGLVFESTDAALAAADDGRR